MNNPKRPKKPLSTSWEPVENWYQGIVGEEGHYYHRQIILPGISKLMESPASVLDLACGQGVLSRYLPREVEYTGIDASASFIKIAKASNKNSLHQFRCADITKSFNLDKKDFTHATIILAVQNLEYPLEAFKNCHRHLAPQGTLILVINHPCFRIPRQSSWGVDLEKKLQYRRIDRYMSQMSIPIQTRPGKEKDTSKTLSFHYPLFIFTKWLKEAGFVIDVIEEWCSDKASTGKNAKMENRAREEIPLFMAIRSIKN